MKLTVFTPTFNRKDELPGLYISILRSMRYVDKEDKVEWHIVDDGSTDDLSDVIDSFFNVPGLKIVYSRKENGGKHTAFNYAIEKTESDIFVCIDDDDRLTVNSLSDIFLLARRYIGLGYGGFVGRVLNTNGKVLGKNLFVDTLISNTIEIRDRYDFWGEPEIFFTSILKQYRFPVIDNEKFLTEAFVFDKMSREYPFVYTNIPMMEKVYLKNGLTDNNISIRVNSPVGTEAYYFQRKSMSVGFKNILKATINRRRFARYSKRIPKRDNDLYELLAIPVAFLLSIRDKIIMRNFKR